MSNVKARVQRLEEVTRAAPDWSDTFDTITVHTKDGQFEMDKSEWEQYHADHPGDYIILYETVTTQLEASNGHQEV